MATEGTAATVARGSIIGCAAFEDIVNVPFWLEGSAKRCAVRLMRALKKSSPAQEQTARQYHAGWGWQHSHCVQAGAARHAADLCARCQAPALG